MHRYKVRIKNKNIYTSRGCCLLAISVGQQNHEDGKLEASIEFVNIHFDKCIIMIVDTLQRHNFKSQNPLLSDEDTYQISLNEGNLWIERNKSILEKLLIPYNIFRWDTWLKSPKYSIYAGIISDLFAKDTEFNNHVQDMINKIASSNIIQFTDKHIFIENSTKYILEETTILLMWDTLDID